MGWISEIFDQVGKLSFFTIVNEYEQGLYFRKGVAIERPVKFHGEALEEILNEEKKIIKNNGGYISLMRAHFFEKKKPVFPEEYKKDIFGLPKHSKRFKKDKVLQAGFYFNIPIIDKIITDFQQEKVLNLGNINVPTIDEDSKGVIVSCNIRYELLNFYKAYTSVFDYEASLKDYTLAILAKNSRGKTYSEWKDKDKIKDIEEKIEEDLRGLVTNKWGLKIHKIYITDNVSSDVHRLMHEGINLSSKTINEALPKVEY